MNTRQEDEKVALQAIYPDFISTSSTAAGTVIHVQFDSLDLEEPRDVVVWEPATLPRDPPLVTPPLELRPTSSPLEFGGRLSETTEKKGRRRGRPTLSPDPHTTTSHPAFSIPVSPSSPPLHASASVHSLTPVPSSTPHASFHNPIAKSLSLRYLPPLRLSILLPPSYPETAPPVTTIQKEGCWLQHDIRQAAEDWANTSVWQAGEECLYILIDSLLTPQLFSIPPLSLQKDTLMLYNTTSQALKAHDRLFSTTAFSLENFTCGICLEPKKGRTCIRLEACGDVFCAPCLSSYFTLLITEGLVSSVQCPSLSCVSDRKQATTTSSSESISSRELEQIVGLDLVQRYERLKEKQRVEADPSISFCPRKGCQGPVPRLEDEEKLRVCPACQYAFCQFCKRVWHGPTTPCALPQSSLIVETYLTGTDEERSLLERKYGKANVVRLVMVFEEDRMNREYIEANSTKCPGCAIPIQKSAGCSHMHCLRCGTHFCFRCAQNLTGMTNPYDHWSKPGSSTHCYNKLFDFLPGHEPAPAEWLDHIEEV